MRTQTDLLAKHLAKHGCTDLTRGALTIGKHIFPAVFYTQNGRTMSYVIGERPPILKRPRKMALRIGGEIVQHTARDDWYVCAYMDADRLAVSRAVEEYHPFGANFLLGLWDVPSGEAIDAYNYWRGELKPYIRVPATFHNFDVDAD